MIWWKGGAGSLGIFLKDSSGNLAQIHDNIPFKVLVRLYGLGVGLNGTPTGDEGTVPITCLKMPTRVDEQGKSLQIQIQIQIQIQ